MTHSKVSESPRATRRSWGPQCFRIARWSIFIGQLWRRLLSWPPPHPLKVDRARDMYVCVCAPHGTNAVWQRWMDLDQQQGVQRVEGGICIRNGCVGEDREKVKKGETPGERREQIPLGKWGTSGRREGRCWTRRRARRKGGVARNLYWCCFFSWRDDEKRRMVIRKRHATHESVLDKAKMTELPLCRISENI